MKYFKRKYFLERWTIAEFQDGATFSEGVFPIWFIFIVEITHLSKKWDKPRVNRELYLQYNFCYINTFTSAVILRQLSAELWTNICMKNWAFLETFTTVKQLFVSSFFLLFSLAFRSLKICNASFSTCRCIHYQLNWRPNQHTSTLPLSSLYWFIQRLGLLWITHAIRTFHRANCGHFAYYTAGLISGPSIYDIQRYNEVI